jgi:hypothetical protein
VQVSKNEKICTSFKHVKNPHNIIIWKENNSFKIIVQSWYGFGHHQSKKKKKNFVQFG